MKNNVCQCEDVFGCGIFNKKRYENFVFVLTFDFRRTIIKQNFVLKVLNMNLALFSASEFFFSFSVVFFFGYAYFALKKSKVRA